MRNAERNDWMEWAPSIWGTKIEVLPEFTDMLRDAQLSDEDAQMIASAIAEQGREVREVILPSLGEKIELDGFDWSTSIDFGHEYDGGGYMIYFGNNDMCDQYGLPDPMMCICIESDSYSEEQGLEREQEESIELAIDVLREFLATL